MPGKLWQSWRRLWRLRHLKEAYRPLLSEDDGALVSIDCETSSLKVKEAEILSIAAVRIEGNRLRTSDAFYTLIKPQRALDHENIRVHGLRPRDFDAGLPLEEALEKFLRFTGGRTLLGYYLQYDIAVLNKHLKPILGAALPNHEVEVSGHYYDWRFADYPDGYIDLSWETIIKNLHIPALPRHDAMNDAITVGMMYLALQARGHSESPALAPVSSSSVSDKPPETGSALPPPPPPPPSRLGQGDFE
ncbi:MAG: 3'-5' exonuclease [Burkholderiales bacterium]|jgi:DNA polymerase-3 subunit epsilon|nr:3'-5' exonuclease [Burkholderiales bacterium]